MQDDTKQCYPSCEDYDSGVDSFAAPTKYMIWSSRMNTHVWPAYVISFRVPSFKGLCVFKVLLMWFSDSSVECNDALIQT